MRMHRSAAALVACAALVGAGLVAPASAVADDDAGGRVVWNQYAADFSSMHLVSSRPDGSRQRALTHVPDGVYDQDPVFSPDGELVVFNRYDYRESDDGIETVGVVRAGGGRVTMLDLGCVDPCAANDLPSWTPDGSRIVFTRVVGPFTDGLATSAVLYTARPDGTDLRRLSPPGAVGAFEDLHARFAPDGRYLVFARVRVSDDHAAVFRMRPDGTDVRQLTPWELNADLPDVSPARSGTTKDLVAFETFGHGGPVPPETSRVATVPATCSSVADCASRIRYVTADVEAPDQAFNPAWSPDGRRIAYCSLIVQDPDSVALGIITTVRYDGRNARRISDPAFFSFRPSWTAGSDD